MKRKLNTFLSFMLATALSFLLLCSGETASAASSIYVNDSQNVLSGDISSAYAVGDTGTVSVTGGTYAITGDGVVQIGGEASTGDNVETPEAPLSGTVTIKNSTVKIGLYYKTSSFDTAVSSSTLTNTNGSGFGLGYFDSSRAFVEVANVTDKQITIVPDTNTSVSGSNVYCYHIKLSQSYSSFTEAQNAALQYTGGFPAYYSGTYYVLVGQYASAADAQAAVATSGIQGTAFSASSECTVVTSGITNKIIFEYDCGTSSSLAVAPRTTSKAITKLSNNGYTYYGSFIFDRYNGNSKLTVISVLNVEDYVKGVIPYEMGASWPIEALKAGAIAARNYVQANYDKYSPYGFDIVNTASDQVYQGTRYANSTTDSACDTTANMYLTYNGQLCNAFYYAANGGASENSENVFLNPLGYCKGKADPFEAAIDFYCKSWCKSFTTADISSKLSAYNLSTIASITATYTESGNVFSVTMTDINGKNATLTRSSCMSFLSKLGFSYTSMHFTVTYDSTTDTYTISGGGSGHNIGMSQWGANSMAKVYNKNYRQILGFYYTDVAISQGA